MDTTTIEIRSDQREELERRKQQGDYNSLKAVIADLLEHGETTVTGIERAEAREIAEETVVDMVSPKALEGRQR